jgi:hypothetical protein
VAPRPRVVEPPKNGLWRVGRSPDPLRFSDPLDPALLENRATGNRFDSPTGDWLSSDWECWALFEDVALNEQERRPIPRDEEALSRIAGLYGLTVF